MLSPMVFWLKEGNKFLSETFHIITFILLNFAFNKSFSLTLAKFLVIDTSNNVTVPVINENQHKHKAKLNFVRCK